jgi:hypothetical protein
MTSGDGGLGDGGGNTRKREPPLKPPVPAGPSALKPYRRNMIDESPSNAAPPRSSTLPVQLLSKPKDSPPELAEIRKRPKFILWGWSAWSGRCAVVQATSSASDLARRSAAVRAGVNAAACSGVACKRSTEGPWSDAKSTA